MTKYPAGHIFSVYFGLDSLASGTFGKRWRGSVALGSWRLGIGGLLWLSVDCDHHGAVQAVPDHRAASPTPGGRRLGRKATPASRIRLLISDLAVVLQRGADPG